MADSAIVMGAGTSPWGGEFVLKSSVTVECTDRGSLFLRFLVTFIASISLPISRAAAAFNALSSSSDSGAC